MQNLENLLNLSDNSLISLLNARGAEQENLWEFARQKRKQKFGNIVFLRGLISFSNVCRRSCQYCQARNGNNINRCQLKLNEIMDCIDFIWNNDITSVILKSGEMPDDFFKEYLIAIINKIKNKHDRIHIILSCGEMDYKFYKELNDLGIKKYLLRIATGNNDLYKKLHPYDTSHSERVRCLEDLKSADYHVETGNIIGIPEQTDFDIIADLRFLASNNFDSFVIGPFIIIEDTPIANELNKKHWNKNKNNILNKTLNFISMLRIITPSVKIATPASIERISENGTLLGLMAGANMFILPVRPKNVDRMLSIVNMEEKIKGAGMKPEYRKTKNSFNF